jgi:hypothetical protein
MTAPDPAIGQHLRLDNLHIIGIASEHALQITILNRGE